MKLPAPAVDYRSFRISKLQQEEYRHIPYLLFWPVFGLRYAVIEHILNPAKYHEVYCFFDDWIPFLEGFLIPYALWYLLIIGTHLYAFLYDIPAFKWYSRFMITAFSISTAIFIIYPTCQNLRPPVFSRQNALTKLVKVLYWMDTNTNVCPSEHVIGSIGAFLAAKRMKSLQVPGIIPLFAVTAFLAAIATVFLKQHSILDVLAAFPVCFIAWLINRPG